MNTVLRQLNNWRFRERLIRLTWGGGRWLAIVGTILGVACLTDWAIDRYSGSQTWRDVLKSSWVFAGVDPLSAGETPYWFRFLMTAGQVALAGGLTYFLLVRPWFRTPPVDQLASQAEMAFPEFDHRLVTAIQLNRPTAKIQGMSKTLIAEVTREAGEIASRHNLLKLVDYRRVGWAVGVLAPVVVAWLGFVATNASLAGILVKRQALLDVDVPRNVQLKNVTQEVWPTGAEVTVRFEVSGEYQTDQVGVLRVVPDGQPEEFYELVYEKEIGPEVSCFVAKLPPASRDFSFQARLGGGRTKEPGRVTFEFPPQLAAEDPNNPPLTALQVLPTYLGTDPDGNPYVRRKDGWTRGEVVEALPQSKILVEARFNKPVKKAQLIPIERGEGIRERDLPPLAPFEISSDRQTADWGFPTTPRMIGYRIELIDDRTFTNPVPIRRNVRMFEDRPPFVEFKPESNRDPDPKTPDGQGNPKDYEWDAPVTPDGRIQVIYNTRSDLGIRAANVVYRVVPRGVAADSYPEEYKKIQHPREDTNGLVYNRLPLKPFPAVQAAKLGRFVPELGLFEKSGSYGEVEFWSFPSANPRDEPGGLEAAGCKNFEVSGLLKKIPDGTGKLTTAKLELGDTVELYVEVFDKLTVPGPSGKPVIDLKRPAGYTREAKRKIVVTEEDARMALRLRDEVRQKLQDKLRDLANDQTDVFKQKKK